jgi:protein phosphatase
MLTRDHTMAQDFVEHGVGEVAGQFRHVLTQALGGRRSPEPQTGAWKLRDGDRVLLCSDGLTDMVDESVITAELGRHAASDASCRALVDRALEAGGKDNVTVAIAGYHVRRDAPR